MEKKAECRMESASGLTPQPTRVVDGGTVEMRSVVRSSVSTERLGGKEITLKLTGLRPEQTARVVRLIEALKSADAEAAGRIVDELKGMSCDA